MTVYFVRRKSDPAGHIKIGFTRGDPERRMRDMAAATPGGFEIIDTVDGGPQVERAIHVRLSDHAIAGEWFHDHPDVWAAMYDAKAGMFAADGQNKKAAARLPIPEDEFSESIVLEARFYLNELVKREWLGMGDTVELARDRVMDRNGLSCAYGSRLWNRSGEFNDVAGEVYRCLWLNYAEIAESEGIISDNMASRLAAYRKFRISQEPSSEGSRATSLEVGEVAEGAVK